MRVEWENQDNVWLLLEMFNGLESDKGLAF